MRILTRMCTSLDGHITTPNGWPVQLADPEFSPERYGFDTFQQGISAVLMGRTTFEPALGAEHWPWPDLDVYVLGSRRPEGTPEHVIVDDDPSRLHERIRADHADADVHLVGGPKTIEAFRAIRALNQLGVIVLPILIGGGLQFTPAVDTDTRLTLAHHESLPNGALDIAYQVEYD